jgi:hypothetical protein
MECAEIVLGLSGTEARLVISLCEMRVNEALFDPLPRAREDELSWTAFCAGLATMALHMEGSTFGHKCQSMRRRCRVPDHNVK